MRVETFFFHFLISRDVNKAASNFIIPMSWAICRSHHCCLHAWEWEWACLPLSVPLLCATALGVMISRHRSTTSELIRSQWEEKEEEASGSGRVSFPRSRGSWWQLEWRSANSQASKQQPGSERSISELWRYFRNLSLLASWSLSDSSTISVSELRTRPRGGKSKRTNGWMEGNEEAQFLTKRALFQWEGEKVLKEQKSN